MTVELNLKEFKFFLDHQIDSVNGGGHRRESSNSPPENAPFFISDNPKPGEVESKSKWTKYLEYKYLFFQDIIFDKKDKFKISFEEHFDSDIKVLDSIQNLHEKQLIVYLQRVSQINKETIDEEYYDNENKNFRQWSSSAYKNYITCLDNLNESQIDCRLIDLNEKSHIIDNLQKEILQTRKIEFGLMRIVNTNENLRLEDYKFPLLPNPFSENLIHKILKELLEYSLEIREKMENNSHSFKIEKKLTELVSNLYSYETCDYLYVNEDSSCLEVKCIANSDNLELLNKAERYSRGEGITGSIFYLNHKSLLGVGTPDIENDLRISSIHKKQYEESQNITLRNYWLFPLYDEKNNLYASLRIINRIEEVERRSFVEDKIELAYLCRLLSCTLLTKKFLYSNHIASRKNYLSFRLVEDYLKQGLLFQSLIFKDELANFIGTIVHMKEEKKSIGITLCVINEGLYYDGRPKAVRSKYFTFHPHGENKENECLSIEESVSVATYIKPELAFFMYKTDKEFLGIYNIIDRNSTTNFYDRFTELSKALGESSTLFYIPRDNSICRIFRHKSILGDLYISDSSGKWVYRDFDFCMRKIKNLKMEDIADSLIIELLSLSWCLLLKKIGSMLVVTRDDIRSLMQSFRVSGLGDTSVFNCDFDVFAELASIDGAILIDRQGILNKAGVILTSPQANRTNSVPIGSRHSTAESVSSDEDVVIVFVTSENGLISCYHQGKAVFKKL